MTEVCDANLAISVDKAGGIGSISPGELRQHSWFISECHKFTKERGHSNFVLALPLSVIITRDVDASFLPLLKEIRPRYLLILYEGSLIEKAVYNTLCTILDKLRCLDIKTICRDVGYTKGDIAHTSKIFDYITLKGNNSAGYCNTKIGNMIDSKSSLEILKSFKERYPDTKFIATGGIYTKKEVDQHFEAGAEAIEIGSLFALSKESSINAQLKEKIFFEIKNKCLQTKAVNGKNMYAPFDGKSLYEGVNGNLDKGFIFLGNKIGSIDYFIEKSVEEIMKDLTC